MHGEALARIANGGARDVAEAHGAVALERQDPRIWRRRHHRAEDAQRDHAAVLAEESLEPRGPGPAAEPADDHRLVALGTKVRTDRRELPLSELYRLPTEDEAARLRRPFFAERP